MKMIKIFSFFVFAVFFMILQSCTGSHTTSRVLRTGTYSFYMSDSLGNQLVEGTIVVDTSNGNVLTGSYEVTKKYVESFSGFRTMQGVYNGSFDKSIHSFSMNMNPKLADANIFIKGKYTSSYFAGEWAYSTYVGIAAHGSFRAEYQD